MKKFLKRVLKIFSIIMVLVLFLALLINTPIIILHHETSDVDYSNWMSENLSDDQKIIDISMLGAHDTFANDIGLLSKVDNLSATSVMMGTTGFFIKGFSVKQSDTQISDINTLLNKGIRYLDVRVTYSEKDDEWYTVHNYYSNKFLDSMKNVTKFLQDNKGEFLIIDLQHIYGVDYDNAVDFDKIYSLLEESGIIDFAYKNNIKNLNQITYGDITNNGQKSGVIILSKFNTDNEYVWSYEKSIRSSWADSDDFDQVIAFLEHEKTQIDSGLANTGNQIANASETVNSQDAFRVMQGVVTMSMSGKGIIKGFTSWSLIERANAFNTFLINQDDFLELLNSMPIVMVDYADSNHDGFLDNVMQKIINFNENTN